MNRKISEIIRLIFPTIIGIMGIIICLITKELDLVVISFGLLILIYFIYYITNQKKNGNKASNSSKT